MHEVGTTSLVVCWFGLNILIGSLNGWILRREAFAYPVVLTAVHMLVCWVLAGTTLHTVLRSQKGPPVSASTRTGTRILSLAFCASVACGNIALKYIYVSFAQMVTAAGPLFTIGLMYCMAGKRYSAQAYASMVPMCGGVMLCTAGELNFNLIGFAAVIAATLLRGVKSILQGKLLSAQEEQISSLELLFHMSGCSVVPLVAYAALSERAALSDPALRAEGAPRLWGLVVLSGAVAFFLNLANFAVTKRTSAVTLQVLGNVKVVLSIAISLPVFGNSISSGAALGCATTLAGVAIYNAAPPYGYAAGDGGSEKVPLFAGRSVIVSEAAGSTSSASEAGPESDLDTEEVGAPPTCNSH